MSEPNKKHPDVERAIKVVEDAGYRVIRQEPWRAGLKPTQPRRTRPFLTAKDLVFLRDLKISLS